jgi:hypothetical protein
MPESSQGGCSERCWQSGQEDCAATKAAKSTGGEGGDGPAMAGGTEDPEGASVDLLSAASGPSQVAMKLVTALRGGGGAEPSSLAGRERVSATMLDSPVI